MLERSRIGVAQAEELAGPSKATAFLSKAAPVLLGAAILGGIAAVGVRIDAAINADLIHTLRENWSWSRFLTSHHSMTALSQMYPGAVEGLYALLGAVVGGRKLGPLFDR